MIQFEGWGNWRVGRRRKVTVSGHEEPNLNPCYRTKQESNNSQLYRLLYKYLQWSSQSGIVVLGKSLAPSLCQASTKRVRRLITNTSHALHVGTIVGWITSRLIETCHRQAYVLCMVYTAGSLLNNRRSNGVLNISAIVKMFGGEQKIRSEVSERRNVHSGRL